MKKYRYILSGGVKPSDPICDYYLVAANGIASTSQAVRVRVDDVELRKLSCDNYSTTRDTRTIGELGFDCLVRIDWRLRVRDDLKPETDDDMFMPGEKMDEEGYQLASRVVNGQRQHTYLSKKKAEAHFNELRRIANERMERAIAECGGDVNAALKLLAAKITDED